MNKISLGQLERHFRKVGVSQICYEYLSFNNVNYYSISVSGGPEQSYTAQMRAAQYGDPFENPKFKYMKNAKVSDVTMGGSDGNWTFDYCK